MPSQVAAIPIGTIEPHPDLAIRFRYDVLSLAEDMKATASESVPNGQLQPGRVVLRPDGKGYWVYIGVRRYFALKKLFEDTKEERFGLFNAYIDFGLDLYQLFMRARSENEEEKGVRQGISLLEELAALNHLVEKGVKVGDEWAKKLTIIKRLPKGWEKDLYTIERNAGGFHFGVGHLEILSRVALDEESFYKTAACVAVFDVKGNMNDIMYVYGNRDAVLKLEWFVREFQRFVREGELENSFPTPEEIEGARELLRKEMAGESGQPGTGTEAGKGTVQAGGQEAGPGEEGKETGPDADIAAILKRSRGMLVAEEGYVKVVCPHCNKVNLVRQNGSVTLTFLSLRPKMEKFVVEPDVYARAEAKCDACGRSFWIVMKRESKLAYRVEALTEAALVEPRTEAVAAGLLFNFEKKGWEEIWDGKVVGFIPILK